MPPRDPRPLLERASPELARVDAAHDLVDAPLDEPGGFAPGLRLRARRLLLRLLRPILRRQSEVNAMTARLIHGAVLEIDEGRERLENIEDLVNRQLPVTTRELYGGISTLNAELYRGITELQSWSGAQQDALLRDRASLKSDLDAMRRSHGAALEGIVRTIHTEMERLEQALLGQLQWLRREQAELLRSGAPPEPAQGPEGTAAPEAPRHEPSLDALMAMFEDKFRGTRAMITERLRVYLPMVREAALSAGSFPALDLGCGRGEWLELMREEGVEARGVERNGVLAGECRERGLTVVLEDMLQHLASQPDASIGAITGFHVVEHVPLEVLVRILDETVRVLRPGGLAIFETPNPANLMVGSHTFHIDPTHLRPIPAPTLQFLAEARGLRRVRILELHPFPPEERAATGGSPLPEPLERYLFGPRDYAIVAWADATAPPPAS